MSRSVRTFLALLLFAIPLSCGETQPPPPSALLGKKVLTAVRELARAYEQRDKAALLDLTAKDLPGRDAWEQAVTAVFAKYEKISLKFQGTKMLAMTQDRGPVRTAVNWEGEWRTAGGDLVKDGGRVTLVFEPGGFLLTAIEGKDPFLPSEKQTTGKQ